MPGDAADTRKYQQVYCDISKLITSSDRSCDTPEMMHGSHPPLAPLRTISLRVIAGQSGFQRLNGR